MQIKTTRYYEEFLRYYDLALKQQERSNLGHIPHHVSYVNDELMKII